MDANSPRHSTSSNAVQFVWYLSRGLDTTYSRQTKKIVIFFFTMQYHIQAYNQRQKNSFDWNVIVKLLQTTNLTLLFPSPNTPPDTKTMLLEGETTFNLWQGFLLNNIMNTNSTQMQTTCNCMSIMPNYFWLWCYSSFLILDSYWEY